MAPVRAGDSPRHEEEAAARSGPLRRFPEHARSNVSGYREMMRRPPVPGGNHRTRRSTDGPHMAGGLAPSSFLETSVMVQWRSGIPHAGAASVLVAASPSLIGPWQSDP